MVKHVIFISDSLKSLVHMNDEILQLSQKLIKNFICLLYGFWTVSKSITWSLITLKGSNLVKWLLLAWSFMWWCQFIDWLKFEACPSSLHNFGMAYRSSLCIFYKQTKCCCKIAILKKTANVQGILSHLISCPVPVMPVSPVSTPFKSLDLFTISPYLKSYVSFLVKFWELIWNHIKTISPGQLFFFFHITDRLTIYLSSKVSKEK